MKELNDLKINSGYTENLLERLLADPAVKELMEKKGVTAQQVERNMIIFANWRSKHQGCESCTGLDDCVNDPEGYQYDIDAGLYDSLRPCKYLKQRREKLAHKANYLLCDLSEKNLDISLDTIDLTGESRNYRGYVSILRSWRDELPGKGLYLFGGLGVGKSYLAACLCNDLAKQGKKVAFVNFPRLCTELRNNVTDHDFVEEKLKNMRRAYVLVIDDIGAENMSNYIRDDILFTVLDYRMEHEKRTIFTSNCSLDELTYRLTLSKNNEVDHQKADRIIERIRTLCDVLPVSGTSRRG